MELNNDGIFSWLSIDWFYPSIFRNFTWENPSLLYLIPALLVIFIIRSLILHKVGSKLEVSFPESILKRSVFTLLRIVPFILLFICFSLIIVCLARPQKSTERVEQMTKGIDIMVVMDISKSMDAMDLRPNRLEAAKKTARNFVLGRVQDRIGIVVFSGEAFSLSPLTSDYDLLKTYISEIKFNLIEQGGTAIGSALAVAINRMKESKAESKIGILLSDGDNNAGNIDPMTAAKLALAYNIKFYTILIGKDKGQVPLGKDMFGNIIYGYVEVDPSTLRKIAETTGGQFYMAATNKALEEIFAAIDKLEKTEIKINRYKNVEDFYFVYLKWAILFLLLWLLAKNSFLNNFLQD